MVIRAQMTAPVGNVEDKSDALQGGNEGPSPGRKKSFIMNKTYLGEKIFT